MDFEFSEDQQAVLDAVREFCEEELKPKAEETDASGEFPWENLRKMAELDLFGIPVSEEYGGLGMDFLTWAAVGMEISQACTTTGAVFGAHMLAQYPLMLFGTEEQKRKYLTPLATGEKIGAFGLTEPGAGSDAGNVRTSAVLQDGYYVLNGSKIFITNAGPAEIYIVIGNLRPDRGARGMTAFIFETGYEGFTIGKNEKKMAFPSLPNRELIFQDAKTPAENVLAGEKRGFRVAMQTLDVGRIGMGIGAVGVAEAALKHALSYAKERVQFGQPISAFQAIQVKLADMATEIECARLLCLQAAWLKDTGKPFEKQAAMAKLFASEVAMRTTTQAVQVLGGYGYTKEFPVERLMREAKLFEIVEGTSEIQRLVIANHILK
jgi:butyryl-CoA dehydrogenase